MAILENWPAFVGVSLLDVFIFLVLLRFGARLNDAPDCLLAAIQKIKTLFKKTDSDG